MHATTATIKTLKETVSSLRGDLSLRERCRLLWVDIGSPSVGKDYILVHVLPLPVEKKSELVLPDGVEAHIPRENFLIGLVINSGCETFSTGHMVQFPAFGNMGVLGDHGFLIVHTMAVHCAWSLL